MEEGRKVVFISYSWEDINHQNWVLKLAGDLQSKYGIIALIDRANMTLGSDLPYFMENSIIRADKVIAILTPQYKEKAEARLKGVGYETTILSQELVESPITKIKILPVLRKGSRETSLPKFLSSKINHSMVEDDDYDYQLLELAKAIYDEPLVKLPELGDVINLNLPEIDPFISKANSLFKEEQTNREIDQLLFSYEGKYLADEEIRQIEQLVKEKQALYETHTDLKFTFESNNRDIFLIKSYGYTVSIAFENIAANVAHKLQMRIRYWKGNVGINRNVHFPGDEPRRLSEAIYQFDLDYQKQIIWKKSSGKYNKEEITNDIFNFILEKIQVEKKKTFRR